MAVKFGWSVIDQAHSYRGKTGNSRGQHIAAQMAASHLPLTSTAQQLLALKTSNSTTIRNLKSTKTMLNLQGITTITVGPST